MSHLRWLVCASFAVTAAACGVPVQDEPQRIAPDRLPPELAVRPAEPSTTIGPGAVAYPVFLIDRDRLVAVDRTATQVPDARARLDALRAGPTPEEAARGMRSSIGESTPIRVTDAGSSTASVDVAMASADLLASDRVLAVAQVVLTLTGDPGIDAVLFTVDGRIVATPVEDGTLVTRPVRRTDYAALL